MTAYQFNLTVWTSDEKQSLSDVRQAVRTALRLAMENDFRLGNVTIPPLDEAAGYTVRDVTRNELISLLATYTGLESATLKNEAARLRRGLLTEDLPLAEVKLTDIPTLRYMALETSYALSGMRDGELALRVLNGLRAAGLS